MTSARIESSAVRTALLPNLGFSQALTCSDDPVYAFGTLLRQQRFTQSDFDLNSLNRPRPLNNFSTRLSGNWIAFDSFRTQLAIRGADLRQKAAQDSLSRSDQQLVHEVVNKYQAILLASRHLEVVRHEVETAQALLDSSKTRVQAGLAVDSDQLVAMSYLAERQQELIEAEGDQAIAWAELEHTAGSPISAERQTQPLAERQYELQPLDQAIALALNSRPDRQSLAGQAAAQQANLRAAQSSYGPTVSAYGTWETDRKTLSGSGGNNWLAGVELRFDLLPVAKRQQVSAAKVAVESAHLTQVAADNQIRLEVTRAWYAHRAAGLKLEVARASVAQSDESLRILKDRYEAGLTTFTELLRVEDAQRQSAANYWQAVYSNTLTWADLQFAMGTLNPTQQEGLQ